MNQKLKAGILLVTLAIPVFIWLFLKNFGQNQFAVPIYYEAEVPDVSGCDHLDIPHQVRINPDSGSPEDATTSLFGKTTVHYLLPEVCDSECQVVLEQLANLQTTFSENDAFQMVVFASAIHYDNTKLSELQKRYLANPRHWKFVLLQPTTYENVSRCELLIPSVTIDQPLVLTDQNAMIRGYYYGIDPDEIDRLKGELKILFYMQETANHVKSSK